MHRIIRSHLTKFSKSFELEARDLPKQFEYFVNYCCAGTNAAGNFELGEITTESDDSGIDGLIVVIDDEVITTRDSANELFSSDRRARDVTVIFTQAKSGEAFQKVDILAFGSAVTNFLMETPNIPLGDIEQAARGVFDAVVENVSKIRGGKPRCKIYFATTGVWDPNDEMLTGALEKIKRDVAREELFQSIDTEALDRGRLVQMWTETYEPVDCTFKVLGFTPIPSMPGVSQAYVTVAPAGVFIEKVLDRGDGRIRTSVFQENVRSFLGLENEVNTRIGETLAEPGNRNMFAVLNNGVTIVAPEVKIQSDQVNVRNFQIVNGCQTSHVLFLGRANVDDSVTIPIKVIESDDPSVVAKIVEATNSQSRIRPTQFFSLRPKVREIEKYFDSYEDEPSNRIYLERREKQYAGHDLPAARILDIDMLARAYSAMFLDVPHLSARYPKRLMEQMQDRLFQDDHRVEAYYAAAFASYRWHSWYSNRVFPGNYSKYKFHMLMAIKYLVVGDKVPNLSSKKMSHAALRVAEFVRRTSDDAFFGSCIEVFRRMGEPSRDTITTQSFPDVLRRASLEVRSMSGMT